MPEASKLASVDTKKHQLYSKLPPDVQDPHPSLRLSQSTHTRNLFWRFAFAISSFFSELIFEG